MELTTKEMQLSILALVNYKDIDPELWDHNEELLKDLNSLIIKFQTYLYPDAAIYKNGTH